MRRREDQGGERNYARTKAPTSSCSSVMSVCTTRRFTHSLRECTSYTRRASLSPMRTVHQSKTLNNNVDMQNGDGSQTNPRKKMRQNNLGRKEAAVVKSHNAPRFHPARASQSPTQTPIGKEKTRIYVRANDKKFDFLLFTCPSDFIQPYIYTCFTLRAILRLSQTYVQH